MKQEDLAFLADLYNNLLGVHTSGIDSFQMTDCMRSLQNFIFVKQEEIKNTKQEEIKNDVKEG